MTKSVKMKDIAEAVGVSAVTVSKALSGQRGVSEELRAKIRQMADEMGYQAPPPRKQPESYNIGILMQENFLDKYTSFYWQLNHELTRRSLVRGCMTSAEMVSRNDVMGCKMPAMIRDRRVDGIVVSGPMEPHYIAQLEETCGVPVVYMDYCDSIKPVDAVISNSFYGTYALTNYLFEMGHWDIGYVGTLGAASTITDRYLGYVKSLMEHRVRLRNDWLLEDRDLLSGTIDMERYARLPEDMPTAFVCNSDVAAAHLIRYLRQEGFRVPDDISVVGFGDYVYPGLCDIGITTYEADITEMARRAFQKIIKRMGNEKSPIGTFIVDGRVVCKDSVARR